MTDDVRNRISAKYCPRFGQLAVEFGFISEAQLAEALASQVHQELAGRGHRLLGEILFRKKLVSAPQIDQVMRELLRHAAANADQA
ncbi:MAG: hypothetical protein HY017_09475 [Betaproteobacteria bacterium]|nr:hypothetical protein [Betaproteobacteria bacterium]